MNSIKRTIGASGIETSALGLGCWAIGGVWYAADGKTAQGWSGTEDKESVKAVRAAIDNGVNLFDTANVYGCGHSERILGEALQGRRDDVVLSSKFGWEFDEETRIASGSGHTPRFIRSSLEESLRRLKTEYLDVYFFHDWGFPAKNAEPVRETLEELVKEGKIRTYGWSTDLKESLEVFKRGPNCNTAQVMYNIFEGNPLLIEYAEQNNMSLFCRSPLAMGLLSAKYDNRSQLTGKDIRNTDMEWLNWFKNGKPSEEYLKRRDAAREILTSGGRTLVQGALAWLWGRSDVLIPIPGFKNVQQAVENARAMEKGPLTIEQVEEVEKLVSFTEMG